MATTIVVAAVSPTVAHAAVATSCSYDAGTATVTATIGSGVGPVLVRSGDAIDFDGSPCGVATVLNTDTINITTPDTTTIESPTISIAGGQFVPGKTGSQIAIHVDLTGDESITLIGSDGPDVINMRPEGATLVAGSPSYQVTYPVTTATGRIFGGDGNDDLRIKVYASVVDAGPGDDVIHPANFSPSSYDGGTGADLISYAELDVPLITVHGTSEGDATVERLPNADDTLVGIETVEGSTGSDTFFGSSAADHFLGNAGNDRFVPLQGDDTIDGGDGYDTLSTEASTAGVTVDMTTKQIVGEGTDSYSSIEILYGSQLADVFAGDPGGILEIDGLGGRNLLDLGGASSGQTVYLYAQPTLPPTTIGASGMRRVVGSAFRDHLVFSSGDLPARFQGGAGHDRLIGGPLDDRLYGGTGDDTLNGRGGTDVCNGGPGTDTVSHCEST